MWTGLMRAAPSPSSACEQGPRLALQVHMGQLKLRAEHPSTAFGNGDAKTGAPGEASAFTCLAVTSWARGSREQMRQPRQQRLARDSGSSVAGIRQRARSLGCNASHAHGQPLCVPALTSSSPSRSLPPPAVLNPYADSCILLSSQIA